MNKYKICNKCKKQKDISEFRYNGSIQIFCKQCTNHKSNYAQWKILTKQEVIQKLEDIMSNKDNNISNLNMIQLTHVLDFLNRL